MEYIKKYKTIIISSLIILLFGLTLVIYLSSNTEENNYSLENTVVDNVIENNTQETFYVDIKGEVRRPGVYLVDNTTIVQDVIKLAGGLTKNANTSNINLSQAVTKEMVIYVFSKKELKETTCPIVTPTCETKVIDVPMPTTKQTTSKVLESTINSSKININTASKEQLMTIPNVGESKADSIIIYRKETPFTSIEDIKNVSGIGESVFAKIKDYITV